ncbi:MAG TPA: EAL domain-containing protein [Allosphingosinicella sp.]
MFFKPDQIKAPAGRLASGRTNLNWRRIALAGAAVLGVASLVTGVGTGIDRQLHEARFALRSHPATGAVHIVEIDANSLARISRWPWPRSVHASAVDALYQAGARSIAFDVDFSGASDPQQDRAFAASLRRAAGSVILPTFRQSAGDNSASHVDNVPLPVFSEHAFLAAVNVQPDADGYVRRMPLGVETVGTPRPSLPSLTADIPASAGEEFEVDYSIDPQTIPRHSLVDLISGKVPAGELAGKRVIIGATAIEMGDRYSTPRHGVIPGVVIQAIAAETLLEGSIPQRWPASFPLIAALLVVALAARREPKKRHVAALAALAAALVALPLATEILWRATVGVAPALVATLTALVACTVGYTKRQRRSREATDPESGLPNLVALEAALAARPDAQIVVAQIDRFAVIASGLGAEATAKLVLRVAERLSLACGARTIYRTEPSALAWIEAFGEEESLDGRLEGASALMRAPVECGRLIDVSVTFGAAAANPAEGNGARQVVANAGLAAVHAAQRGSRWQKFSEADSTEAEWELSLLVELDAAMAGGAIWNAYQPKLDLATGEVTGVETLVRWNHRLHGPIGPDRFIPLIEAHGRAGDLTTHVLRQALDDARCWASRGFPIGVAVNVSANLLADHGFIESVRETLRGSPVPANLITIEVTESATMTDPERALRALQSWRELGLGISIDDYGTGQSSLAYLQTLPATELKIDKSFVQSIASNTRNAIMVRSTIALAHELGMKVVGEGIEDGECLGLLREMGCDTGQGFHIARPMPAQEISALLEEPGRAAA